MRKTHTFYLFDLYNDQEHSETITEYFDEERVRSDIDILIEELNEAYTFASVVKYHLKNKNLTSKDIYERAYIDRRLLHKILTSPSYHPSKKTVLALCIALRLNYYESIELLGLASYSFVANSREDIIYSYFVSKEIYDLNLINNILYQYDCPCIGD